MNQFLAIAMLFSGGLFAGGAVTIALERIPAWRQMDLPDFGTSFTDTVRRMDRVQPALLTVCLLSTAGFVFSAEGTAKASALFAAAHLLLVLVGSVTWLVPLQRRLVARSGEQMPEAVGLRRQWVRGHLVRMVLALIALILIIVAAVS